MISIELLKQAEKALNVSFKDKTLLSNALTHRSFVFESKDKINNYERLEFLGDSVLNFAITKFIYTRFPSYNEGELSKLRAAAVNSETLYELALKLNLENFVQTGKGVELAGVKENISILSGCFEAIIGAIFLDQGLRKAEKFLTKLFGEVIEKLSSENKFFDFKTTLQEEAVQRFKLMPEYKVISELGPPHNRLYHVEVNIGSKIKKQGKAGSKKKAEQLAAKEVLKALKIIK